jgi:hypothetical protein
MSVERALQDRGQAVGVAPRPDDHRRRIGAASVGTEVVSHPRATPTFPPWIDAITSGGITDPGEARHRTPPRSERLRRAVKAVVAQALEARGYEALTYPYLSRLAGVEIEELEMVFPSKAELVLAAIDNVHPEPGGPLGHSGRQIVARYLAFWEHRDNTVILREILSAAFSDRRLAVALERHVIDTVIRPFAEEARSTDAYPRARLALSQLVGLAVSRYVLPQQPLASADRETLAAWIGPCLDHYLHQDLGHAVTPAENTLRRAPTERRRSRRADCAGHPWMAATAWTQLASR